MYSKLSEDITLSFFYVLFADRPIQCTFCDTSAGSGRIH